MKESVFILYTCDVWHSSDSYRLLGVYTSQSKAIAAAKICSYSDGEGYLSKDDVQLLKDISQTQNRSTNYVINEEMLNPAHI